MCCRGCLFVIVDVPSGGDIDGCLKDNIIDCIITEERHTMPHEEAHSLVKDLYPKEDKGCFTEIVDDPNLSPEINGRKFWKDRRIASLKFMKEIRETIRARIRPVLEEKYGYHFMENGLGRAK